MKQGPDRIRIGILGTGAIAHQMAKSLEHASLCSLSSIASRDLAKSREFANHYENSPAWNGQTPRIWGSYADLVADPNVDLVYIATPHNFHCEHTLLALRAGKHVLVEKPFALIPDQSELMIKEARTRRLFLMEAMWTRFIPAVRQAREMLKLGSIGQLISIQADLGFNFPFNPEHRIFNPLLGGGAMLDLGIYPLSLASFFAGIPIQTSGLTTLTQTGVDASDAFCAIHSQGAISSLYCTINGQSPNTACLTGTAGSIQLGPMFINADTLTLHQTANNSSTKQEIKLPYPGPGYHFEADEAAFCIQSGLTESPDMKLDESLALTQIMDNLLKSAGVHYPS